ncbi:hypothetical protein TRICI_001043 [Trichomonascus ciferrii]|uniref:NAD(P)-binding protein n=1 Tax=Trichomonascus ciferrii TaxID=44093 RepID=A0A642VB30_9ASCO|nr:hypothetical protein TRICI_001043 [Trichomonascus ciferrii]
MFVNRRFVDGWGDKLDKERDIIVITGGSSGLGLKLSALFAVNGYQVVVLDVKEPDQLVVNVAYRKCDVSREEHVKAVCEAIVQTGKSIVLINNAGIAYGKRILDMDSEEIEKTIDVNLKSSFWTIRSFLPTMLKQRRGYIVTVSSVLGYIGPGGLTAYSASKGGLNTFHDSLTHELDSKSGVRTLLVTVGQMETEMFSRVETPSKFLAPVLQTTEVALKVFEAVENGACGELSMPLYARLIHWTKLTPQSLVNWIRQTYGMDNSALNMSKKTD